MKTSTVFGQAPVRIATWTCSRAAVLWGMVAGVLFLGGCCLLDESGAKEPGVAYVDSFDLAGATCGMGKRVQAKKTVDGHCRAGKRIDAARRIRVGSGARLEDCRIDGGRGPDDSDV